jgi:tetratricopeptide (TPR) repeat protein
MKDFFISYTKADEAWAQWIAWTLEEIGFSVIVQAWDFLPGSNFVLEMQRAMREASKTIALLSNDYLKAQYTQSEWANAFANDPKGEGHELIPIKVGECNPEGLLQTTIHLDLVGCSEKAAKSVLLKLRDAVRSKPEEKPAFPRMFLNRKTFPNALAMDYFSESWPSTDPRVIGRDKEITFLAEAWEDPERNIVCLVGFGGVGKTALLNSWLIRSMRRHNWRGARRVFGWSFYNQGAGGSQQASADLFIGEALRWFGDPEMAESSRSPWEKGLRLAALVRQQKTLLLLDGLEPLQEPIDPPAKEGRLKDSALRGLLHTLANNNPGLCILTTRSRVEDIRAFEGTSVLSRYLEGLTPESGVTILRALGVTGPDEELKMATEELGGHALALILLGSYLSVVHGGEIRQRSLIPPLTAIPKHGAHAVRVMQGYQQWLEGKAELNILYALSLFDRPPEDDAMASLRMASIHGLTDQIHGISKTDWKYSINTLRRYRLLAVESGEGRKSDQLDCHPLVRAHFGEQLREKHPCAWAEAHSRLYEYYQSRPREYHPESINELELLYRAMAHACQAGRFREALNDIYMKRILRGQYFSWKKFGNFGMELVALSKFFDHPWDNVEPSLDDRDRGFILNEVGFHLMALARLQEAVNPMNAALELFIRCQDLQNIALAGNNLCKLYLLLGSLDKALDCANRSLGLVDEVASYQNVGLEVARAATLHQLGRLGDAAKSFRKAEAMHKSTNPKPRHLLLFAFRGLRYGDLLIDIGDINEITERIAVTLRAVEHENLNFFALGISHLFLEQAHLFLFREGIEEALPKAVGHMHNSVECLRRAGQQGHIVRALLARAELLRLKNAFAEAQNDLDEVTEIATRSGMRRFECDAHLESFRLTLSMQSAGGFVANRDHTSMARNHLTKARVIIEEIGYQRRDPEILLGMASLDLHENQGDQARRNLSKARIRLNEMGCHRWDREVADLEELL